MLASREALHEAEASPIGPAPLPDFGTSDFTLSVWARTPHKTGPILAKSIAFGRLRAGAKVFLIKDGKLTYEVAGVGALSAGPSIDDNRWHHVVVTGSDPVDLYVDGHLVKTGVIQSDDGPTPDPSDFDLTIGWCSFDFPKGGGFEGDIDEVRIYNRKLSAEEVNVLHKDPTAVNEGVAGWWRFDVGAVDSTENYRDGTIFGAVETAGKFGGALRFGGTSGVALPTSQAEGARARVWELLARDYADPQSEREMAWEREDGIWNGDWAPGDFQALADRYAAACRDVRDLRESAQALGASTVTATTLREIRQLYHSSRRSKDRYEYVRDKSRRMVEEIAYLDELHRQDDAAWIDYSQSVVELTETCEAALSAIDAGDVSAWEELPALEKKLASLHQTLPHRLPMGPPKERGKFGALYTHLKYKLDWDEPWRVGEHPDVVVTFDNGGHRFVFWRGANYIPNWVTENAIWYNNEFIETWIPGIVGSFEPMSDKQCRYSHVRVIENHDARVVIHWRYALCDVDYQIAWPDDGTGWGDWADEYYVIYPDAVGVRKMTCHSSHWGPNVVRDTDDAGHEWHEGIVVYHAHSRPEESLELDAVHVSNMDGEVGVWSWDQPGQPTTPTPDNANIVLMNVKSGMKPFVISPRKCELGAYTGSQGGSHFRWRDHWPTTMEPTPGRDATGEKAAHGSFFHLKRIPIFDTGTNQLTKVLLHGMTGKSVGGLAPLARSWLNPPELRCLSDDFRNEGYDRTQRAYVLTCMTSNADQTLDVEIEAGDDAPLLNPAVIVKNWGPGGARLEMTDGGRERDVEVRMGYHETFETRDLVIWIEAESTAPVTITLTKTEKGT